VQKIVGGLVTTARWKILSWLGATLRFEHFDDPDASRFQGLAPPWIGSPGSEELFGAPGAQPRGAVVRRLPLRRRRLDQDPPRAPSR
jgi:hypothetical protein